MDIEKLLEDYQPCHSDFQIDHFIIGKQGDLWAQYKQCLREINSRYPSVKSFQKNGAAKKKSVFKKFFRKKHLSQQIDVKDKIREFEAFVKIAIKLKKHFGEITEEKRQRLETESWVNKARKMAGVDFLVNGRITQPTMEMILALPAKYRISILLELKEPNPHKMLEI